MKILPLALALSLVPTVARAQTEDVSPDIAPVAPSARTEARESFRWKFAPPVGSHWQLRSFMRTETKSTTPFPDGTLDARLELVVLRLIIADYDVLNRDQWGATNARLTLRQVKTDVSALIDGKKATASDSGERAAAVARALQNASITIKQAPTGEIWSVAGAETLSKLLADALAPHQPREKEAQLLADSLASPAALRQIMGLGTSPAYPILTSESWPYAIASPPDFNFQFDLTGTRTLNRLTPEFAFVGSSATYDGNTAPVSPTVKQDDGDFSYDTRGITASVRGAARVERSSGLTLESTSSWRSDSTILSRPGGAPQAKPLRATSQDTVEMHTVLVPR